ncbi:alpha/beta fold hydrolase [Simplicispira psychrophila]|uniref:alpha/beta fold hydrolase n=1 Tax=Simplicispira psychrophila TaxID=80882 RepID=UPI00056B0D3C|nr:alpha/beta hydrolase-fold protein [Simplicispira psychrophila]
MRTRTDLYAVPQRSETLLVLLPPALSSIDDFDAQGFVSAVRQRDLPVDLLLADVTAQQVLNSSVVSKLHSEVLQPARANGYRAIWLAGISLGAFNALYCAASHADQLAGLYLMAPYTGTGDVLAEIRAAGGAAQWCQKQPSHQDERTWWQWLGQESLKAQWPTPVYFATGDTDRFLSGQRLLADLLPPERVRLLPGSHQWPTWKTLWEDWLDNGPLACRPQPRRFRTLPDQPDDLQQPLQ